MQDADQARTSGYRAPRQRRRALLTEIIALSLAEHLQRDTGRGQDSAEDRACIRIGSARRRGKGGNDSKPRDEGFGTHETQ